MYLSEDMFLHVLANHWNFCCAGVMHFEDQDHNNGQEVTSWKVLSPNAIQVRNVVPLIYYYFNVTAMHFQLTVGISRMVHQNNIPKLQYLIKC